MRKRETGREAESETRSSLNDGKLKLAAKRQRLIDIDMAGDVRNENAGRYYLDSDSRPGSQEFRRESNMTVRRESAR
jgi:hypothetical protein